MPSTNLMLSLLIQELLSWIEQYNHFPGKYGGYMPSGPSDRSIHNLIPYVHLKHFNTF